MLQSVGSAKHQGATALSAMRTLPVWGALMASSLCLAHAAAAEQALNAEAALSDIVQITAGGVYREGHTCAVSINGVASCWGRNDEGQLGDGTQVQRSLPTPVLGLTQPLTTADAGARSTCGLSASGAVFCWGGNGSGQLGDGSFNNSVLPVRVQGSQRAVVALSVGDSHACVLDDAGIVACWGSNSHGQLGAADQNDRSRGEAVIGLPPSMRQVSAGGLHSCAIDNEGGLWCWGSNDVGQLGDGTLISRAAPAKIGGLGQVIAVAAGRVSTCALSQSGSVQCWGGNGFGELGDGTFTAHSVPAPVINFSAGALTISAGEGHYCSLLASGAVRCWGYNAFGQLGDGSTFFRPEGTDTQLQGLRPVRLAAGGDHTCALLDDSGVTCWGNNEDGQLGDGTVDQRLTPAQLDGPAGEFAAISAGSAHTCGITAAGGAKCWGSNFAGELGVGDFFAARSPEQVVGLTSGLLKVEVGKRYHSCALTTAGAVKCWGSLFGGPTPTDVPTLSSGIRDISPGYNHNCALTVAGGVKCWGSNFSGELGNGSDQDNFIPQDVIGLNSGVRSIASASFNTCALLETGAVSCWGASPNGPVRTPTVLESAGTGNLQLIGGLFDICTVNPARELRCWQGSVPSEAPQLVATGVTSADVGGGHICVILEGGSLRCRGLNARGQLGDGSTAFRGEPSLVSGLDRAARSVSLGDDHSCAITDSGATACWGANFSGQLGVGGRSPALPARVLADKARFQIEIASPTANAASSDPVTDAAGRYLVFDSAASNLVNGDNNGTRDVFRRDRSTNGLELVSVDDREQPIAGDSIEPSVSADGQLIAFVASDSAVQQLSDEPSIAKAARLKSTHHAVFLRNMQTGTTRRIDTALPGGVGTRPHIAPLAGGIALTSLPATSGEGNQNQASVFVIPLSRVGNEYVPGPRACATCAASSTKTGKLVVSDGPSNEGVLSARADWLAFSSRATNLTGGNTCSPGTSQVYLRNMQTGQVLNISAPATPALCGSLGASRPSIDWSGSRVVFETGSALSASDTNALSDIYLYEASGGSHRRLSEDPRTAHNGLEASSRAYISGDGKTVSFQSLAKNLESTEPDNNETNDIFVRNLETELMRRVSRNPRGDQGNAQSDGATLSYDGASIVFASRASNLILNSTSGQTSDRNGVQDVFQTANPLIAKNRSGTWWIPSESGWGLFTVDQGNALGVGWFTYDDDGEPTWFVGAALEQGDGTYEGEMFRQTGTPLADITGLATESSQKFADITLRFTGSGSLRFEYRVVGGPSQTKQMSRFIYNGEDLVCRPSAFASRAASPNASDLWWGGAETSGWGIFVNQVRDLLVATWYTYDTDHEALFLTAVARRQPDGRYEGEIYRQSNGTPLDQINGMPPSLDAVVVGRVDIRLLDGETADYSYSIGSTQQTKRITRYSFGSRPAFCEEARP